MITLADIERLRASATPEGLRLEYKLKQDPSTSEPGKDDRRSIAEAIVAFANSDGGILIYGVATEKRNGSDVASSLVPIEDVDEFVGYMRLTAELNVSPQIKGLEFQSVHTENGSASGFAVCHVPALDHRPHMSTAPNVHRYYRRSFAGSAIMTPSEVRDQILAAREAILKPVVSVAGGGSFSPRTTWIGIEQGFSSD